ncbi:MAG: hypothetical protein HDS82_01595, partial [Bacteroidales bacterium]|nr:hypothetical protein [Bacteroidales bacterium]
MNAKFIALAGIPLICFSVNAVNNDTIPDYNLGEVVVQAPKVIHKADMDVYHPSKSAVDNSK